MGWAQVKRSGSVVREPLAWIGGMHGIGELGRLLDLVRVRVRVRVRVGITVRVITLTVILTVTLALTVTPALALTLLDLGLGRLHPDQVRVGGVRLGTRRRQLDAMTQTVVAWLGLERWGEGAGSQIYPKWSHL